MSLTIKPVTTERSLISDDKAGSFMYKNKANRVDVAFYVLPSTKEVTSLDFAKFCLACIAEWKKAGLDHLVSGEIENPAVIKALAQIDGVRIFWDYDEVTPEDILNSKVSADSFDCSKNYTGERVGPYRVSIPLNGPAKPPFTWFEYDPNTRKVLKTFEEKPTLKGYYGATELFEVGDEQYNDHYVGVTGEIIRSVKKNKLEPVVEEPIIKEITK